MEENIKILVLGDASIDWHIVRMQSTISESVTWQIPGGNVAAREGGVRLMRYLFDQCLRCEVYPKENIQSDYTVFSQFSQNVSSLNETMTICTPFLQEPDSRNKVIRAEKLYGFRPAQSPPPFNCWDEIDFTPNVIVVDDSGSGIRTQVHDLLKFLSLTFSKDETKFPWLVIKVAWPILENPLLIELTKLWGQRLIVVAPVDDLRRDNIQISRGLSWERTTQDLSWEFNYNPRMKIFAGIHSFVVPIGLSGIWFTLNNTSEKTQDKKTYIESKLVYDPSCIEGDWEKDRPGFLLGYTSCLTLSIVSELRNRDQLDLIHSSQAGISMMRTLHTKGYSINQQKGTVELPVTDIRKALENCSQFPSVSIPVGFRHYSIPHAQNEGFVHHPQWSILKTTIGTALKLFELGMKIVKSGTIPSLGIIPYARFGGLITVDRNEIEAFRTTYDLIQDYCKNQSLHRPLSIAVFGPPGSGKSFGVAQVAKMVAGSMIEKITFNVSQFNSFDDLVNAFHRVRDIGLSGKIPLVFWDEFDSGKDKTSLFWLKFFLSPMQDGEFTQGQINHPIGRAIFVFAGGTASSITELGSAMTLDDYRTVKVPDFKSRLRGCINIVGIDRTGKSYVTEGIIESDPQYVVRRAIILRSIIERARPDVIDKNGRANIDDGLLKALLSVWSFKHGVRSMESIVELCHLGDAGVLHRSSLPPQDVLALHVETKEFYGLITADVEFRGVALETLASAFHEMYRKKSPNSQLAKLSFDQLSEEDKDKNRAAVKGIPHKLASLGYIYELKSSSDQSCENTILSEDAERLARLEHDRWIINKIDDGFIYGEFRDDSSFPPRHPDLVPWDDIDSKIIYRRYPEYIASKLGNGPLRNLVDIEIAKEIPEILSSAGYRMFKLC